ncbi:MAG: DUF899 family protein [Ignavibacteria bacterium]|nr:DUF899 family protein [Ignavibacteria bacterium]
MGSKEKKSKKTSFGSKIETKLRKLEEDIAASRKKMVKLLAKAGARDVEDYEMKDTAGNPVKLSEMFGDKENLILIHNMGRSCSYCTLWADGFSGVSYFIEKKAAFALTSPDSPEVQKEFAESRGWKLKTYSTAGSTFTKDMGYQDEKGGYWPGVSVFHKESDGKVKRIAKDFFGPGDFYSSPFHLFDLLPKENGKDYDDE